MEWFMYQERFYFCPALKKKKTCCFKVYRRHVGNYFDNLFQADYLELKSIGSAAEINLADAFTLFFASILHLLSVVFPKNVLLV